MSINRFLAHHTWSEVAALDKTNGVVILPIGAVEQHGHHLPLLTDTLIVNRMLDAALAALPDDVATWVLPTLPYGKSNEHTGFPGTISLGAQTLMAVLHDIARSLADAGFRRLAFLNGHGGNAALLEMTAREIRVATGLLCFSLQPALFVEPPFPISTEERRLGFHGGELETSLLLTIAPELVDMEKAVRHYAAYPVAAPSPSQGEGGGSPLFFFGPAASAWLSRDWSESGIFGDATLGTAEKGDALIAAGGQRLAELIRVISTFETTH
jgi:creatinine amidohydrolase